MDNNDWMRQATIDGEVYTATWEYNPSTSGNKRYGFATLVAPHYGNAMGLYIPPGGIVATFNEPSLSKNTEVLITVNRVTYTSGDQLYGDFPWLEYDLALSSFERFSAQGSVADYHYEIRSVSGTDTLVTRDIVERDLLPAESSANNQIAPLLRPYKALHQADSMDKFVPDTDHAEKTEIERFLVSHRENRGESRVANTTPITISTATARHEALVIGMNDRSPGTNDEDKILITAVCHAFGRLPSADHRFGSLGNTPDWWYAGPS